MTPGPVPDPSQRPLSGRGFPTDPSELSPLSGSVGRAELAGYISPTGQTVSFLVPVFHTPRGFLQQQIGHQDVVEDFVDLPASVGPRLIVPRRAQQARDVGDPAVFAFRFPDHSIVTGTKPEVVGLLRQRRRDLSSHPFAALAVARFLGDVEFGRKQVFKSARRLDERNRDVAEIWLETELRGLEPDLRETRRRTFARPPKDSQLILQDIKARLAAGWGVYVRLRLERSSAGISPKLKNALTAFQLGKARTGTETQFLPVTRGTLRNLQLISHLVRVVDVIELPSTQTLET